MTKQTKWHVHPATTQDQPSHIYPCSLIRVTSLCAQWEAKDPRFLYADSEDSDQTGPMPGMISIFAGHTGHFVGFAMLPLIYVLKIASKSANVKMVLIIYVNSKGLGEPSHPCSLARAFAVHSHNMSHVWENLFLPYANNKGGDQPAHPHSLIRAFVVHCLDSIIPLVSISKISSL